MRSFATYRGYRRNAARTAGFPMAGYAHPPRHGKRLDQKEMIRRAMIPAAMAVLMTGPKSQRPKFKAVMKTVRWLLASELHVKAARHIRGSWRSWSSIHTVKEAA